MPQLPCSKTHCEQVIRRLRFGSFAEKKSATPSAAPTADLVTPLAAPTAETMTSPVASTVDLVTPLVVLTAETVTSPVVSTTETVTPSAAPTLKLRHPQWRQCGKQ